MRTDRLFSFVGWVAWLLNAGYEPPEQPEPIHDDGEPLEPSPQRSDAISDACERMFDLMTRDHIEQKPANGYRPFPRDTRSAV